MKSLVYFMFVVFASLFFGCEANWKKGTDPRIGDRAKKPVPAKKAGVEPSFKPQAPAPKRPTENNKEN